MAQDWFSSGLDAISGVFGNDKFNKSNPMSGASSFNNANPFTQAIPKASRNPFLTTGATPAYSPFGATQKDYGNPLDVFTRNANERIASMMQQYQSNGSTGQSMGQAVASGMSFANGRLDDASGDINSASAKYGVPANLIKAMIARESSGDWARDGSRAVYLDSRGESILPYVGIMESTAAAWGYNFQSLIGNRAGQIDAMANGLSRLYQQVGGQYGWEGVINTYYSGDPTGGYTPSDSYQYGTTSQYLSQVKGWWDQLDAASGSTGTYNATGAGSYGNGWASAWGGGNYAVTQEFGMTDFASNVLNGNTGFTGMYDYATSLGVQGHAGVDVGMPSGTKIYAPSGGTVIYGGGSGYYQNAGGDGAGRGEFRLQMDNGDILILGHMSSIALVPGQRIEAGSYVGTSGSYNGDHLHYEVRKSTPGATSSGYTAVDPRQYFNGTSLTQQAGSSLFQQTSANAGLWWKQSLSSLFRS